MSRQKKTNRKTSAAASSSTTSSSMCSSENGYWQTTEQPMRTISQLSSASNVRSIYPNVPKRTRRLLSTNDSEIIDTESRIDIIPSGRHSSRTEGSSNNRMDNKRRGLDLLMKYTSPTKEQSDYRLLSPIQSEINIISNRQTTVEPKSKRTLSPLNEIEQESRNSKRPKSFDDDDDEDIFELIDHRRHRSKSSQISNTSISSQSSEQIKATVRKPTARKFSTSQQKPSASQPIIIEPDIDLEITAWSTNDVLPLNDHPASHQTSTTPIILSPIELSNESTEQNTSFLPIRVHTPIHSVQQTFEHPIDNSSPCSNQNAVGRRFSSTSSASLLFDTPNSSFSRTTTTMNTTSTPQPVMKNNIETQISMPSYNDMINQLIRQMNLSVSNDKHQIDYNPNELSKQFFQQSSLFFTNDKHRSTQFLPKKQFLNFGRYEIEILLPTNENQNGTVHICDRCLKYFPTSAIAYQRHTGKCLSTRPPGKAIFMKDNLAIFQINGIDLTLTQRLYLNSLCRMTRLFLKTTDDSNIDRFAYYILCRQDPILSPTQSIIYRFIGYSSQQHLNNLSRLFILPPFIHHYGYEQLLISLSYSLIRLNSSSTSIHSSPARPIDHQTLIAFRTYWLDVLSKYLLDHRYSSSFSLDSFTRETSIHPRDILFSLYSSGFLIRHDGENSSVYLDNNAYHSMTCLNRQDRNKFLHLEKDLIDINDEGKPMIDKANSNRFSSNNLQEIILD